MVFDSSMAIVGTKKMNVLFNKADLDGIVFNLVLFSWVNQNNMMHAMLPKNPRALLNDLEVIKQVMDEKQNANFKAKAKEASAASGAVKGSSKKGSTSRSPDELQIPKKGKPSKFCQHCKAKGSSHLTHTIKECRRYNGMGYPVSSFQTKSAKAKNPAKKGGNKQMAFLLANFETLVKKGLKKAKKGKKRTRNHAYDSSSSDSNSE